MAISKGDKAIPFNLLNTKREEVSLDTYSGNSILILFFPLAFTSVCTTELCSIRDNLKKYEDLNTQVLGISVDSPFTLEKFKAEQNLNFPLLSDFNKEVSKAYGAFYENFVLGLKGVSKRSAFVVDSEGTIQYAEVLDNAGDLPNFEAIEATLKEING